MRPGTELAQVVKNPKRSEYQLQPAGSLKAELRAKSRSA
jgi:hypothetical protein